MLVAVSIVGSWLFVELFGAHYQDLAHVRASRPVSTWLSQTGWDCKGYVTWGLHAVVVW